MAQYLRLNTKVALEQHGACCFEATPVDNNKIGQILCYSSSQSRFLKKQCCYYVKNPKSWKFDTKPLFWRMLLSSNTGTATIQVFSWVWPQWGYIIERGQRTQGTFQLCEKLFLIMFLFLFSCKRNLEGNAIDLQCHG